MNKTRNFQIILLASVMIMSILAPPARPQSTGSGADSTDIGRENPFEALPKKTTPRTTTRRTRTPSAELEPKPELFIETITLKFLSAKNIKAAVDNLTSNDGVVVVDQDNNALIISDTKESIEKIAKKLRALDQTPTHRLVAQTVTLRHLQASTVLTALKDMSSRHGTISADRESNSIIVRDTLENLERIIEEIRKIDRSKPQTMLVESMRLEYLKAENVKDAIEHLCSEQGSVSVDMESNSLIIRDTRENIEKIIEQVAQLDSAPQMMFVETVTLKFLKAENLKLAMDKMSSEYGSISVDEDTNSLVVCDTKGNVERIIAEIKKADKTPKQIMVEVVLADVQLDDATQTGVNLYRLFTSKHQWYAHNFTDKASRDSETLITPDDAGPLDYAIYSLTGNGAIFAFANMDIEAALHLIQEKHSIEILANPRVLVVSGQRALIKTVEEIPYQERFQTTGGGGGVNAMTSIQFKEVGITLDVKATVTDEGKILMEIKPEQSVRTGEAQQVGGGENAFPVPIVDTRSAESILLMEDGQVAIMGGLRRKETTIGKEQVPILGDIPILGFFFSSNSVSVYNSELLVFISPHIHRNEPLSAGELNRFNELRGKPLLSLPDTTDPVKELMSIVSIETDEAQNTLSDE